MTTTTEKLLNELNEKRGLKYPDIGYSYFADVTGNGIYNPKVYTIVNENGGVSRSHNLNGETPRKRCTNIRDVIANTVRMHFRKFPCGEVIALMPNLKDRQYIDSYQHIGQHGAASPELITDLEIATADERADLVKELEGHGYNVVIID